jgi:tRNA A37 threonylcarbamoyltransferase TsaD
LTSIVIAGGVARNNYLRSTFTLLGDKHSIPVKYPDPKYCTGDKLIYKRIFKFTIIIDNGVMIAWAGIERYHIGKANFISEEDEITKLTEQNRYPLSLNEDLFTTNSTDVVNLKRKGLSPKFCSNQTIK